MGIRARLLATLSQQLGNPSGPLGVLVANGLNKGNGATIRSAVDQLDPKAGEVVADIGFGGGLGLALLLERAGEVYGVDPSPTMVARAARQHRAEVEAGRLHLHGAPMESMPLGDGALDGWISLNTIYFIDDLAAAFAELARVTTAAGRGVLGVADPEWLSGQPFAAQGFTVRPVDDVVAALEAAGFGVLVSVVGGHRQPYNLLVCTRR